jgi:ABC-type multidrug transport system fused ATPase/permease subunit
MSGDGGGEYVVWNIALDYLRKHPVPAGSLLASCVAMPLVELLLPVTFGRVIEAISNKRTCHREIMWFVGAIVLLQISYTVHDVLDVWVRPEFAGFVRRYAVSTVVDVMKSKYDLVDIGDVVNRTSKLPWSVDTIVNVWVFSFIPMAVMAVVVGLYVGRVDVVFGLTIVAMIVLYMYVSVRTLPQQCTAVSVQRDRAINTYMSKVDDLMRNLCSVYVERTKDLEMAHITQYSNEYLRLYRRTVACFLPTHAVAFVIAMGIIGLYYFRTQRLFVGGAIDVASFTAVSLMIVDLVLQFLRSTDNVKDLTVHYGIMYESLELLKDPVQDGDGGASWAPPQGVVAQCRDGDGADGDGGSDNMDVGVTVRHVTLRTLRDYTRHFPPGRVSVVRGQNGCGKTTLFKVILDHVKPTSGSVTVWGRPNVEQLRRIGYVPQSPTLFDRTVYANVVYGNPDPPSRQEVARVVRALDLDAYIPPLDRAVGKSGSALSGGQRQLIVFLRVLLNATKDVWLMDEPTSALDAHAKKIVLATLEAQAARGKTIIAIMH